MLGPFSVDSYLPAFPAIQNNLGASALEVQQTLTVYMLSFSVMILWHGALSDAFGRRSIVLISLAVYAVASLGCASAHSVEYLWAFRMLQGISAGAGVVIGRAIIRDLYAGASAERMLSLVTMIFSISPAIAPIIGGWVVGVLMIGVDAGSFWSQIQGGVDVWKDVGNGVIKSIVFGFTVTFVALLQGYGAQPTPEGVASATTRTVVVASLAVLGLDFILTAMMFTI